MRGEPRSAKFDRSAAPRRVPFAPSPADLNRTIEGPFSHYDVKELLGVGGMGEVYLARDRKLGRDVALKILPPGFALEDDRRARFLREARLAASITHPNVATIHEADEFEGQLFYAMELLRGDTLQARVRSGGLPLDELLALAIPLTEGLAAAHRQGIVHRDLKPNNVMVDAQGYLKILDFGLSRIESDAPDSSMNLTRSAQILGTPFYMSPEQVRGQTVDTRSDLFAMGTILYELGCGVRPFFGTTQHEIMESVVNQTPAPMARANPRVDDGLQRIVTLLLEKVTSERTQTADDLLAALRRLRTRQESRPASRRSWLLGAGAIAVAALIAVVFSVFAPNDGPATGRIMLAVLPFENIGDAENASLSAGITASINTQLASVPGLAVIAPHQHAAIQGHLEVDPTNRR
jgi:serine/threonine protein kinase